MPDNNYPKSVIEMPFSFQPCTNNGVVFLLQWKELGSNIRIKWGKTEFFFLLENTIFYFWCCKGFHSRFSNTQLLGGEGLKESGKCSIPGAKIKKCNLILKLIWHVFFSSLLLFWLKSGFSATHTFASYGTRENKRLDTHTHTHASNYWVDFFRDKCGFSIFYSNPWRFFFKSNPSFHLYDYAVCQCISFNRIEPGVWN